MSEKKVSFKKLVLDNKYIILMVVFSLISAICLYMKGDDFLWYYCKDIDIVGSYQMPNGRIITNTIAANLIRFPVLKSLFCTIFLPIMSLLMGRLIGYGAKKTQLATIFSFMMIMLIPRRTYAEVINWFSGYVNYIFSFVLTLTYILIVFRMLFREDKPKSYLIAILPILGFISGLCVEHLSIYNILFAIAAIVLIRFFRKKLYIGNFLYLTGAITSFVLMMTNRNYSHILSESDEIGMRNIEFGFSDMYMNLFRFIEPIFIIKFWAANLVITAALLVLLIRSGGLTKFKYSRITMLICVAYSAYSVFTSCYDDTIYLTYAMRIRGIEATFTFLHIISIVYLCVKLFKGERLIRCIIFLVSTVITALPFLVVSPVTPRTMFVSYMFWLMLAGELFLAAAEDFEFCSTIHFADILTTFTAVICVILSGFNISNYRYDVLRYRYIREQLDSGSTKIKILDHPYTGYSFEDIEIDSIFDFQIDNNLGIEKELPFDELIFKYHGVGELNKDDYTYTSVACIDYNTLEES